MSNKSNPTKIWSGLFRSLGSLLSFVLALQFGNAQRPKDSSQQIIRPENKQITIQGTIRLIHAFGPPGYGEDRKHDARVTYWAIEVATAINVPCTPEKPQWAKDDCAPAKRLKLIFKDQSSVPPNNIPAAKWKDLQVEVMGKLNRADTIGDMTPIYMEVSQIRGLTSTGEPALCNYSRVVDLHPNSRLPVHAGWKPNLPIIDTLANGTVVYVCDETHDFYQVFYGARNTPCNAGTTNGLPETEKPNCRSGWVRKKWIDVLSG